MKKVIFVAPYFMNATERFIEATTQVENTQVGLVSCDPVSNLSAKTRSRLVAHYAVQDISTPELQRGVEILGKQFGGIDCLLGMLEQIQVPLGEIRDRLGIPGMGGATANHFRDKAVMKTILRDAGLPCARHCRVTSAAEGLAATNVVGFPLIVKPPDGAGAKGTYRCENLDQLTECLQFLAPSENNPLVMEEFVVGIEHSFDSVCLDGNLLWASISHYAPTPLEVVREPWIQWRVMIPRETDAPQYQPIREVAQRAINSLGLKTGLSHMEWFLRSDGSVAISEVGARPPGAQITSLISYAHDFDLYHAWANLLIHHQFTPPERKYAVGAAYLRGMGQGKVSQIQGLKEVAESLNEVIVEAKLPQIGQAPSGSYEGEGYVIVRHPQTRVVENALQKIINTIHVGLN